MRIIVKGVGIRTNRLHRTVRTTEKVQGAICQNVKDTREKARQTMKLIIDIPDKVYKTVLNGSYCGSLYEELLASIPYNPTMAQVLAYESGKASAERPSGDCISREALKEKAETVTLWNGEVRRFVSYETIDNAQTVEAYPFEQVQELVKLNQQFAQEIENLKRPQGEWIPQGGRFSWVFKCSCCGWVDGYPLNERHKYCPNCGAEMRKGGTE